MWSHGKDKRLKIAEAHESKRDPAIATGGGVTWKKSMAGGSSLGEDIAENECGGAVGAAADICGLCVE